MEPSEPLRRQPASILLTTDRLQLRRVTLDDAEFMLRLLNEPSFIQNIGDRDVRTSEQARAYLANGPLTANTDSGLGLWVIELKDSGEVIGICSLLKREVLDHVDIGYALLPRYWSKGYALEAVKRTIEYVKNSLGLDRLAAIVNEDNESSIRLLEKLGFRFEKMIRLNDEVAEIQLFLSDRL